MTLCQFPHWLRTRKGLRWIPLCYHTHDEMETAEVSVFNIVIALLKFWFPAEIGTHSWENGVLLTHEGREHVVLRMRMGPMPQDADAFKHVFSLKGSSGQSPCPWCKNCMHRLPFFEDASGFAHIKSPQHHKFQRHTNDSFFAMVDELKLVHGDAAVLKAKEIIYGLNYEPDEILWCQEAVSYTHLTLPTKRIV